MRSDGTVSGTGVLKDLDPTSMDDWADPLNAVAGKNLYFLGNTNSRGVELWRTDGTPSGTKLVKDINAGSDSSMNFSSNLVRAAKSVYFGAYDTTDHLRLWKTSGTTRSTRRVDDTVQNVSAMALAGSRVFYLGNKGGQIPYLYVSSVR